MLYFKKSVIKPQNSGDTADKLCDLSALSTWEKSGSSRSTNWPDNNRKLLIIDWINRNLVSK